MPASRRGSTPPPTLADIERSMAKAVQPVRDAQLDAKAEADARAQATREALAEIRERVETVEGNQREIKQLHTSSERNLTRRMEAIEQKAHDDFAEVAEHASNDAVQKVTPATHLSVGFARKSWFWGIIGAFFAFMTFLHTWGHDILTWVPYLAKAIFAGAKGISAVQVPKG